MRGLCPRSGWMSRAARRTGSDLYRVVSYCFVGPRSSGRALHQDQQVGGCGGDNHWSTRARYSSTVLEQSVRSHVRWCHTDQLFVKARISSTLGVDQEYPCIRIKTNFGTQVWIGSGLQQRCETSTTTFARDNRQIAIRRICQTFHRADCVIVVHGHEAVCCTRKYTPSDKRRLVTFEHCHYGRLRMSHLHRMPYSCAFKKTRCTRGLGTMKKGRSWSSKIERCPATAAASPPTPD